VVEAVSNAFFPDGRGGDNVRLSFSLVDEASIDEGVSRLSALVAANAAVTAGAP